MDKPTAGLSVESTVVQLSDAPAAIRASGSLASNLAWRAVTDWGAQIISWASLVIVVRLLAPSDFGLVAMSAAFYLFLRLAGEFGIPVTIVSLRDLTENEIAQLNSVAVMLGVTAFLIACALAKPVALFFKAPKLSAVIVVSCASLIPLALRSVPEGVMSKELRFKPLSWFNAIRDVSAGIITVSLAFLGFGYWALVAGNVVGITLRSGLVLAACRQPFAWPNFDAIKRPLLFSRHVILYVFAWSAYSTLDNVTVGKVLGPSSLGFYAMAWVLANVPLEKVVSVVTTIIPSYLAKVQKDPAALRRYLYSLTEAVALATFPATIGVALVARELVYVALGHRWEPMVLPLEILCLYTAFRSVEALLPKLLTAVGDARFVMRVELSALVVMPASFYLGSHWGIAGVAVAWLSYPLVTAPLYWQTFKTIGMSLREYVGAVRPAFDGSILMALGVGLVKLALPAGEPILLRLIIEIISGGAIYVSMVLLLHRQRALALLKIVKGMRRSNRTSD